MQDDTHNKEIPRKPADVRIIETAIDGQVGEWRLRLPALGISRLEGIAYMAALFAILAAFCVALVLGLLAGKVQGSPWAGWAMVAFLVVVGVGLAVSVLAQATKQGSIHLTRERLRFSESNLFGEQHASWRLKEIQCVRLGQSVDSEGEGISVTHFVEVRLSQSVPATAAKHWFSHRSKSDIQWIAAAIQQQLETYQSKATDS